MTNEAVYRAVAGGQSYADLAAALGKTQPAVRAMAGRYARANGLPGPTVARDTKTGPGLKLVERTPAPEPASPDMGAYFQYLMLRKALQAQPADDADVAPGPVDDSAAWDELLSQLRNLRRAVRVLYASDQHFPSHDPLALRMVEDIALWFAPDLIVHGGDVFDMDVISRFTQDFRKGKPDALRHVRKPYAEHVRRLKADNPNARQVYMDGNHTIPRLNAYLAENWQFQDAILDAYHTLVKDGGNVLYMGQVEEIEVGHLFMQHGRRVGKYAARNAQDDLGGSTPMIQGHAHTVQMDTRRVRRPGGKGYRVVQSIVNGCLCQIPPTYTPHTKESKWLQSVTLAHVEMDGDIVNLQPVVFHQRPDTSLVAYVGKKQFTVSVLAEVKPVEHESAAQQTAA